MVNGVQQQRTRQVTETVVTHTEQEEFRFRRCVDASGALPADWFPSGTITRVSIMATIATTNNNNSNNNNSDDNNNNASNNNNNTYKITTTKTTMTII